MKVASPVVLDASAGVEILLLTPIGRRLLAKLGNDGEEWVPELYFAEVAAALGHPETRQRYPPARLERALDRLHTSPFQRVEVRPLLAEASRLSPNLTVAQGVYVVLARHLGAPLVTTDATLATTSGLAVSIVLP